MFWGDLTHSHFLWLLCLMGIKDGCSFSTHRVPKNHSPPAWLYKRNAWSYLEFYLQIMHFPSIKHICNFRKETWITLCLCPASVAPLPLGIFAHQLWLWRLASFAQNVRFSTHHGWALSKSIQQTLLTCLPGSHFVQIPTSQILYRCPSGSSNLVFQNSALVFQKFPFSLSYLCNDCWGVNRKLWHHSGISSLIFQRGGIRR